MVAFSRRRALGLGAGALLGGALAACSHSGARPASSGSPGSSPTGTGSAAHDGPPTDVTIGFLPITCSSPIVAAEARGIFAKHGLRVTLKKFAGWAEAWSAYASGELHVAHMLAPMPLAIHHGLATRATPTKLAAIANVNGQGLTLANRHMGVAKPRDMEGFTLGVPFDFSIHNLLLRDYLSSGGVDPDRDVQLRLMRPADMVANLATGNIDGFLGPGPFNQRSIAAGHGHLHRLTGDMWDGHPCCCLAANADWAADNPGAYRALTAAVAESALWCDHPHHRVGVAETLAPEKYLNQKPELLASVLAGSAAAGSGREPVDPTVAAKRVSFRPLPEVPAGMWMGTQLSRWGLGDIADRGDTAGLRRAVEDVFDVAGAADALARLGPAAPAPRPAPETFEVNGRRFDAADPWAWTDKEIPR
ncbi:ABC transporter substrate-binding protein [Corynebacterium hansenii]|uniref:ABC transporter substrate-binding protein n=1 Tax=Corynebacterium hansenii TaxID=394964 RepID=A0ABV7ZM22_9CORY|nr:ABC transporter substrate-binding protein [Corynebacterium hansenii]WJY98963.1 Nitrate transport protein NrtA precursor [Corynebacterium hansenii]